MSIKKLYESVQKLSRRTLAGLLAVAIVAGLFPGMILQAGAVSWAQPFVDQLIQWGIMRDDIPGNRDPDAYITRAETFSLINRAFGYSKTGSIPFYDVSRSDWFYDEIVTAYNTGYVSGTSPTTVSPNASLTREEAAILLGKNLMLQPVTGETLTFTDSRTFNDWSRGMIEACAQAGMISGYPDGSFQPTNRVTRGELASMIVSAVGYLIQDPGVVSLGNIYSNVTINSAGTTLKDTVIAGNLYLTGGIGLGDVMLDNVTVLGKIVASGAGEGNKGDSSIILRNVRADEMVVDSISNQFVTIQTQGITDIGLTSVRTPSYLEDRTGEGYGLQQINLDGKAGITMDLAGNINSVTNLTPQSVITIAQGVAQTVTIDEDATNAILQILNGGRVKDLNLDVATNVTGVGDIDNLTVYAPGSTVSQLPNTITIRPGISADIYNEVMDTVTAAEASEDPQLRAGFPEVRNIAPTTADAVFSTNKRGTVYWALTAVADGTVSQQDLINHPAYSGSILSYGQITSTGSNVEYTAKLTKLISDGSYYLSSVMVDSRGEISPVKIAAFTTPDDTTPAFNSGYPKTTLITSDSVQVGVMANKSCQLYYAILPKGSTAPTVQNFRAGAISGNLGYGVRNVTKNVIDIFTVNSQALRELTEYTIYMCLVDADGGKYSAVKSLNVKTLDGTPPVFLVEPIETKIAATSVTLTATLNETGTIYWVAVAEGTPYPKPLAGDTGTPPLTSDTAKLQVANGMNALKSGSVRATANKAATINITGLTAQSAYDVYYVAMDSAGNYSEAVKMITIHTLDTQPPKVTLEFSKTSDTAGTMPMPDTDLRLVFDESVQADPTGYTGDDTLNFKTAYDDMVAKRAAADAALAAGSGNYDTLKYTADVAEAHFAKLLYDHIALINADTYNEERVISRTADNENDYNWEAVPWVDYRKVTVTADEGKTIITFQNGTAVRLNSGGSYFFRLTSVTDTSSNHNLLRPNPYDLPKFTTVFAQVLLRNDGLSNPPSLWHGTGVGGNEVRVDMSFQMHPQSTGAVTSTIYYDVILWSTLSIEYDVYGRVLEDQAGGSEGEPVKAGDALSLIGKSGNIGDMDGNGWVYLGSDILTTTGNVRNGRSLNELVQGRDNFCQLITLKEGYTYEIAIQLTKVNGESDWESWSQLVRIGVDVAAGQQSELRSLVGSIQNNWNNPAVADVTPIGNPDNFSVSRQFTDTKVPVFGSGYPNFSDQTDSTVNMNVQLDRAGTIYYAYAKVYQNSNGIWMQDLPALVQSGNKQLMVLPEAAHGVISGTPDTPANVTNPGDYAGLADNFYVAPTGNGSVGGYNLGNGIANWGTASNNYALVAPTYLGIFDPDKAANPNVVYNSRSVGTSNVTIPLTNLEPQTKYFMYVVLKGTSQTQSPVYVFQFETTEARKPIITLQYFGQTGTGSNAAQRVTATTAAAADTLSYTLVASGSVPSTLRATDWLPTGVTPPSTDGSDGQAGFSVLDGLMTWFSDTEGTWFDKYADDTLKQTVTNYIRASGETGGAMQPGTINDVVAGRSNNLDFKESGLTDNTQYFCLAVAEHALGGLAFAAREGVRKQDMVPPELNSAVVRITKWTDGTNTYTNASQVPDYKTNYSDYTVQGTITLTFSKPVYFVGTSGATGGTAYPLLLDKTGKLDDFKNANNESINGVYLHNHLETSGTDMFTANRTTTSAQQQITIAFTGVGHGDYVTLFSDGIIANFSSATSNSQMILRYNALNILGTETEEKPGTNPGDPPITQLVTIYDPGFTITWGDKSWIATNSGTNQTSR